MRLRLTILLFFTSAKLFSQQPDSIVKLATQNYIEEKYPEAIELFTRASQFIQLKGADLLTFGRAFYKNNEYNKAAEIFKESINKENPEVDAYYYLGNTLCFIDTADNYPSAKPYFEIFIKKTGIDTVNRQQKLREANHYLSSFYIYNKPPNYDSAIYHSNKLLELSFGNTKYKTTAYASLTLSQFRKANFSDAELSCLKVLELEPENKAYKEFLKVIKGIRRDNSIQYWQTKINSDTSFLSVKEAIEQNFDFYVSQELIPSCLLDTIKLWVPDYKIANVGEPWQITDISSNRNIPTRQLLFILKNEENVFIVYRHGGLGACNQYIWAKLNKGHILDIRAQSTLTEIKNLEKFRQYILNRKPSGVYLKFL